jgi:diguanylate cyclase (GGDEF)-like protein/PAS domain S-box-containing protein
VELLQAMAMAENWDLQFQACEWQDCLNRVRRGELDLMPDVAFSDAREQLFDFNFVAVTQAWSQVYAPQFKPLSGYADLAGKRVAILAGSVQESEFDALMKDAGFSYQAVLVSSLSEGFQRLSNGDVDAAVVNNFFAWHNSAHYPVTETPLIFGQVGLYFASAKQNHRDLLDTIDTYLRQWRADSNSVYYRAIARVTAKPTKTIIPGWVSSVILITTIVVLALLYITLFLRWRVQQGVGDLLQANQRFDHLLNGSPAIIYSLRGKNLAPEWVSSNIERILGFTPDQVLQPGWWKRQLHPDDRSTAMRLSEQIFNKHHLNHEYRFFDARGKIRYIRDELQLLDNANTEQVEVIGTWTDLTEAYEQKAKLSYLTHYDPLTGLPNRLLLHKHLSEAIDQAQDKKRGVSLLYIDVDRFKNVNDSLGINAGDQVLATTVERIRKVVTNNSVLARTGADEFCVIPSMNYSLSDLDDIIQHLLQSLHAPMQVVGESIMLTVSIGSSCYPQDASSPEQLLTASELAMFAAKKIGGGCRRAYTPELSKTTEQKFMLENALRRAVANDELVLYFQPQFDLLDNTLVGAEALVRWVHPTQGMISPGLFIPLAEEIGIIYQIDNWVLNRACMQLREWDLQGLQVPHIAVNLSVSELDSLELVDDVNQALQASGLQPTRLELELTESMLMRAPESAIAMLNRLNDLGVSLAMDDFGTGYSNLSYLGRLPFDRLKIDQSFVRDLNDSPHNESIVRAIIAMASALSLDLVAEGIEKSEQQAFLKREGCSTGQGYLLGRPMPAPAFFETFANAELNTLQRHNQRSG